MVAASPWDAGNPVHAYNPLGKLPVLILDDGTHLYDSRVIVEYIDLVSPVSRLIPEPARQRIAVKKWEALADGVCDAAAAIVVERRRPAQPAKRRMDRAPAPQDPRRRRRAVARARRSRVVQRRESTRSPTSRPAARSAISTCATPSSTGASPTRTSSGSPTSSASARRSPDTRPLRRSIAVATARSTRRPRVTAPASAARGSPDSRASTRPA